MIPVPIHARPALRRLLGALLVASCAAPVAGQVAPSQAGPSESGSAIVPKLRVMVVGDSWATYEGPAIRQVFLDAGDGDKDLLNIGVPGAKVAVFDSPFWLAYGKMFLKQNPTIDTIHFSMGGVDFLTSWHADDPPAVQAAFFDDIAFHIRHIALELMSVRPNLRVLLTGYDFWNFVEPVAAQPGQLCWDAWINVFHQPTPEQVNLAMMEMELRLEDLAEQSDRIDYVRTIGFLQTLYGYPSKGIPPFSFRMPDLKLPTPPEAMADAGLDCVHPSEAGYYVLAQHFYGAYYRTRFHPASELALLGPAPGFAGAQNTVKVQGLTPLQPALLYFGFRPALESVGGCTLPLLGVGEVAATLVLLPDGFGNAGTKFQIPLALEGRILFTQAVQPGSCRASNVKTTYL
ncbi:MAG: hypothetical protein FJ299_06310 [Planctomycetes bacterium]|nr:hypothetical protein [Planctomycetota bacterium]